MPLSQPCSSVHTGGRLRSQKRQETGDHQGFQPRKGRAWLPPAAPPDPANHSQLSAEEEAALVSEGLEKRLKEWEQTYCQVCTDVVLDSPKLPGSQDQDCCCGGKAPPWSHTNLNALQLSSLLILCWFRENKKTKINTRISPPPQRPFPAWLSWGEKPTALSKWCPGDRDSTGRVPLSSHGENARFRSRRGGRL